jgi:hypothetical protein
VTDYKGVDMAQVTLTDRARAAEAALAQIVTLGINMEHREDCSWVTAKNGVCDCGRNAIIQTADRPLD